MPSDNGERVGQELAGWLASRRMGVVAGIINSPAELGIIVFPMLIGGAIGYLIGKRKNQQVLGLVLGAFLGCIGWIIVAFLPANQAPGATVYPPSSMRPTFPPGGGAPPPSGGQWAADPFGRFEMRYYDGTRWTEHVSSQGRQYTDDPTH